MNVLYLASEVAPYSKTGGLGDVAAALPKALAQRGHRLMVATPYYASVKGAGIVPLGRSLSLRFPFGELSARLFEARPARRMRVLFIDQPDLFSRSGIYGDAGRDFADNHIRFGFFSMAALSAAQQLGFAPDIVHLNDWQTGLAALALARGYRASSLVRARSVFTVHNLAYQGSFPVSALDDLGIPRALHTTRHLELNGGTSFLKAGLVFSDALTTVSHTYAREIRTPELGHGLDGLLRNRSTSLRGILNGVDYSEWDPRKDAQIPARYGARSLAGKRTCKRELLRRFGLASEAKSLDAPLFGMVSRLVEQKGVDLVLRILPRLLGQGAAVVVVGTGDRAFEHALWQLAQEHPGQLGVRIGFDAQLAHWVEAGSDFFLMPSRFEPCGLNQMYSLRYGTVPIVRATGGLEDTVVDLSKRGATGIKFYDCSPEALLGALGRALALYGDKRRLAAVLARGMGRDFSWDSSAREYERLYRELASR